PLWRWYGARAALCSFPTRRSSDLALDAVAGPIGIVVGQRRTGIGRGALLLGLGPVGGEVLALRGRAAGIAGGGGEADREEADSEIGRAHSELQSRENLVCRLLLEK